MHPDPCIAIARIHQQDARRHAEAARRAAEVDRPSRGSLRFSLPRIEFGRRVGAVRVRIAHT